MRSDAPTSSSCSVRVMSLMDTSFPKADSNSASFRFGTQPAFLKRRDEVRPENAHSFPLTCGPHD
jgi:hypothetical protein